MVVELSMIFSHRNLYICGQRLLSEYILVTYLPISKLEKALYISRWSILISQRFLQVCVSPAASLNSSWSCVGNYSQALEDFQECLAIQLKHLPSHSRLLAETHYQLGMTFSYTGQYSQAIQHFSSSIKVIESRLGMLFACDLHTLVSHRECSLFEQFQHFSLEMNN